MERNMDDVVETVKKANERGKKCTLLIGAGCSVTAGIPTAKGFVEIIEKDYTRAFKRARTKTYAHCMAELSLGERRDLIADYVDKAKVNWAHIAIAQLMKAGYVDRVLTTNFDLLFVRACALLGQFPAVYDFAASQLFKAADIPESGRFLSARSAHGLRFDEHRKGMQKTFKITRSCLRGRRKGPGLACGWLQWRKRPCLRSPG